MREMYVCVGGRWVQKEGGRLDNANTIGSWGSSTSLAYSETERPKTSLIFLPSEYQHALRLCRESNLELIHHSLVRYLYASVAWWCPEGVGLSSIIVTFRLDENDTVDEIVTSRKWILLIRLMKEVTVYYYIP